MPSRNGTGLVAIDQDENDTRLNPHLLDLNKLHESLSGALWPQVETTPSEMSANNQLLLYPGRVLIGHDGGSNRPIWAYLWQVNCRGGTSEYL
jgi:hypothetical protein